MKVTLTLVNWACFFIGMTIVWFTTHNWYAMLGAWIASIHLTVTFKGAE